MPTTADTPKCFAEVGGRRIVDWTSLAMRENGIEDIVFIGGYQIDKVRAAYPSFTFRHNTEWERNNILASLFFAEDLMGEPFICCYADILFRPDLIAGLLASQAEISLSVDTDWLSRYEHRSEHPTDDAEKVTVANGVVTRIHREIPCSAAHGEFTGIAKFTTAGAAHFRAHFHRCAQRHAGQPFREAALFEKAYLIHLLQDMIEAGEKLTHVDSQGGYIEVDTQQDFEYARQNWDGSP